MKKAYLTPVILSLLIMATAFQVVETSGFLHELRDQLKNYNARFPEEKIYLHTDKPFYKPGETIWFNAFVLNSNSHQATQLSDVIYVELVDAKGNVATRAELLIEQGTAHGEFNLKKTAPGGIYELRAYTWWMKNFGEETTFKKDLQVQHIITPRLLLKLDFEKEAYGPGDTVKATLKVTNLKNEKLANTNLRYQVQVAGKEILSAAASTSGQGEAILDFTLPDEIKTANGLLNVIVSAAGVEESISRSIPIVLDKISLQFFPEGGYALANTNARIAFKALNEFGKGADVSGSIVDANDRVVTTFESFHMGMGAFELNLKEDQQYFARIESPKGNDEPVPIPRALSKGMSLNLASKTGSGLTWNVQSTSVASAYLVGNTHGEITYAEPIALMPGHNNFPIKTDQFPVGITAFTLFDDAGTPRSERLVFLNSDKGLQISLETDKAQYQPGEEVRLRIKTTDDQGKPVRAKLSIAVVDDQLISFADDKQDHILSSMLLSSEVRGDIQEPSFYFDKEEPKAEKALDYLLMTQGWRRFTWSEVKQPAKNLTYALEKIRTLRGMVVNKRGVGIASEVTLLEMGGRQRIEMVETTVDGHFMFRNIDPTVPVLLVTKKPGKVKVSKQRVTYPSTSGSNTIILPPGELGSMVIEEGGSDIVEKAKPGQAAINISMNPDATSLGEVVVTAYGAEERSAITGSIVQVSPRDFNLPDNSLNQTLAGRVAGVQIQASSGNVGSAGTVVIRGSRSLVLGNEPLYIIDGQVLPKNLNSNFSSGDMISPQEISSISVLKSAEATALYGSSAANGVIIITTKRGYDYQYQQRPPKYNSITANPRRFAVSSEFYIPPATHRNTAVRKNFRTTVYWQHSLVTDKKGRAEVTFPNNDATSAFRITAEGFSASGSLGRQEQVYHTQQPLSVDVKFPEYLGFEDILKLPVRIRNETSKPVSGNLTLRVPAGIRAMVSEEQQVMIKPGETVTVYYRLQPVGEEGEHPVALVFNSQRYKDEIRHVFKVRPVGFPVRMSISDQVLDKTTRVHLSDVEQNSLKAVLTTYPDVLSDIFSGAESILRQPHGCFEQVSASTFPNILALQLMRESQLTDKTTEDKALRYISSGYDQLMAYEIKGGGFEWFGHPPAHEGLTAMGLLQFAEMKKVFSGVDGAMMQRTLKWLLSRRDGKGGFKQNRGKYGFSGAKEAVTNAYILFALTATGESDLEQEYALALKEALNSQDMYRMALVALTAHQLGKIEDYQGLVDLFKETIDSENFLEFKADHSIVRSYGRSLQTEVWALWTTALLKHTSADIGTLERCVEQIVKGRKYGGFGSTQGTTQALTALTAYARKIRSEQAPGEVEVLVNNVSAGKEHYQADNKKKLEVEFADALALNGQQDIRVRFNETNRPLAYSLNLEWYTKQPASNEQCKVSLSTSLNQAQVNVNETVRLTAKLKNTTAEGIPMTLAVIGIPAGLSVQPWQLREMKEKGVFDFYEMIDGNLVVYYREMAPGAEVTLYFDLKAEVPGEFLGAASSAWLYYTNEFKYYTKGERIIIN
jgi:TonB-dependent SusC/RagA subfamily outer membrane receptor